MGQGSKASASLQLPAADNDPHFVSTTQEDWDQVSTCPPVPSLLSFRCFSIVVHGQEELHFSLFNSLLLLFQADATYPSSSSTVDASSCPYMTRCSANVVTSLCTCSFSSSDSQFNCLKRGSMRTLASFRSEMFSSENN